MREKLSIKDKIFWKNFFMFIGIFIGAWLILGSSLNYNLDDEPTTGGYLGAFILISVFCIIWFGYKTAKDQNSN